MPPRPRCAGRRRRRRRAVALARPPTPSPAVDQRGDLVGTVAHEPVDRPGRARRLGQLLDGRRAIAVAAGPQLLGQRVARGDELLEVEAVEIGGGIVGHRCQVYPIAPTIGACCTHNGHVTRARRDTTCDVGRRRSHAIVTLALAGAATLILGAAPSLAIVAAPAPAQAGLRRAQRRSCRHPGRDRRRARGARQAPRPPGNRLRRPRDRRSAQRGAHRRPTDRTQHRRPCDGRHRLRARPRRRLRPRQRRPRDAASPPTAASPPMA